MPVLSRALISFCVTLLLSAGLASAGDAPSAGASGMAGAKGTFEFKPADWKKGETSWWKDSDGIAPGVAGCHLGADSSGALNGRMFGEACLDNGLLVESNPGAGVLHSHKNDTGHPDTFDCNAWCKGNGASKGACSVMPAPPCAQSAMCACE
ncbi:MAG: hypothetical protein ABJ308_13715 [Halieaceae bacterium]